MKTQNGEFFDNIKKAADDGNAKGNDGSQSRSLDTESKPLNQKVVKRDV